MNFFLIQLDNMRVEPELLHKNSPKFLYIIIFGDKSDPFHRFKMHRFPVGIVVQ